MARRLALGWGVQPLLSPDVLDVDRMTRLVIATAKRLKYARTGQTLVIAAGMPIGTSGSTNLLRIAQVDRRQTCLLIVELKFTLDSLYM